MQQKSSPFNATFFFFVLILIFTSAPPGMGTPYTDNPEEAAVYQKVLEYFNAGNTFEAHRLSREFIKNFSGSIRIAEIYFILGESEAKFFKSIFYLRRVTRDFSTSFWAVKSQFAIAMKYYTIGNYRKAEQEFRVFTINYPSAKNGAKAHFYRGLCLVESQNPSEAEKSFKLVIKKFPAGRWATGARINMGHLYLHDKKYPGAISFYNDALQSTTGTSETTSLMEKLGRAYLLSGQKKKGMSTLRELISVYPQSTEAKRVSKIYFHR